MDVFSSMGQFNMASMLKFNDITQSVQGHLVKVYMALAACMVAATLGVFADLYWHIGGTLSLIATIGMMMWMATDSDKGNAQRRMSMLLAFGFFKGASLGALVEVVLMVDPSILVTAVMGTSLVFLCFSGSALLAKRRSYLYLCGTLSSLLSFMFFTSLFNMFAASPMLFDMNLYIGLLVFCGYVLVDTQIVVEKASLGDRDFAWHALELFVDLVAIFVRVCIILLKNSSQNQRKQENGRARGRR